MPTTLLPTWVDKPKKQYSKGAKQDGTVVRKHFDPILVATASFDHTADISPHDWVVDTGVTVHITPITPTLSYGPSSAGIRGAGGEDVAVAGEGDVRIQSATSDNNCVGSRIKAVLHCPSAPYNLLSVSMAQERCATFTFGPNNSTMSVPNVGVFPLTRHGRLYILRPAATAFVGATLETWHARLGHLNYRTILQLQTVASDVVISGPRRHSDCEACRLGKGVRAHFPKSQSRAADILALLHLDLMDSHSTPDTHGHRYALVIVDDFSRANRVYLVRRNQTDFMKVLSRHGITHQFSSTGSKWAWSATTGFSVRLLAPC
jgi:hypothetical protein